MDFLRIRSRRVDREFIEDQDPKVVDAPSLGSYRRNQLSEFVCEALDALPEIYREVLMLHYFGGMTIKDIAIAVGALSFALGGFAVSAVEEYDPATDTWEKKADMLTARQGVSSSVMDGKIYAIGGGGGEVEEYDPKADSWTKKAPMPTARANLSTCEVDGKIYAIGGQNGMGEVFSTVEVYDPAKDTWMTEVSMPTARAFLSVCAVNGKLYSIGGTTDSFVEPKVDWPVLGTVEEYDTEVALPTQGKPVEATGKAFAPWGSIKSD